MSADFRKMLANFSTIFPDLKNFGRRGAIDSIGGAELLPIFLVRLHTGRRGGGNNSVVRWAGGWANLAAPYDGQQLM